MVEQQPGTHLIQNADGSWTVENKCRTPPTTLPDPLEERLAALEAALADVKKELEQVKKKVG